MKHQIISVLTVIFCICLMTVFAVTAAATESSEVGTTSEPAISDVSGSSSESSSSDGGDSSSDTSSGVGSDVSSDTSSDTGSDSTSSDDTSSDDSTSDDTSSGDTTSKRPVTDGGNGAGNTFIDENGSQVLGGNTSPNDSSAIEPEDENHFQNETTTAAVSIYKVIWIPILLCIVCIIGLVYVNIFMRPRFEPVGKKNAKHKK